ncbi:UDP-glucuronate 5'-epimerase (UDP-glucuronic acidepimerase) [Treponema primitia ZAS-2]|uniref:UDP-glucuronate 5'-epimerase (UDP-glucuronic acidepimerase) n=1 Tax=Treponema primitia (strain ATCC BAA-887 / DSM 12427 / ZAS-2) TaxID=545694 RepID=F5YHL1_TREPZ|nr:NAD-dependent epimerase/dehydratase family protein [Treponema primitia]AEF84120.1 UDP-glucuronate 5'-epimerase (UDP-glucuronic acidepimerase) [Treponema primitia ZAS-2]
MNYIVTGAAGFIGFYVTKKLLEQGHQVLGIDSLNDYYPVFLKHDRLKELGIVAGDVDYGVPLGSHSFQLFKFVQLKLEDKEALASLVNNYIQECGFIDRIIHLAAQAGVRYSIQNPDAYITSNIAGFLNILELCRSLAVPHLVYASSSSVYGMNSKRPFSVQDQVDHPVSLYAATKRSNELMAHTYAHLFNIPVTGLRFFTVYGPWGRPDMAYYKFSLAISKGEPIDVYNNGEMLRDFTYIDDITDGVLKASERLPSPAPGFDPLKSGPAESSAPFRLYNLGNNRPEKLKNFIETLETALGTKAVKRYLPMQEGDVAATEADIEDTRRDLDWEPRTDINAGLKAFAEWFNGYYNG